MLYLNSAEMPPLNLTIFLYSHDTAFQYNVVSILTLHVNILNTDVFLCLYTVYSYVLDCIFVLKNTIGHW